MSEVNNLIDLSIAENESSPHSELIYPTETGTNPSNLIYKNTTNYKNLPIIFQRKFLTPEARNSLDNNPFDKAEREANCSNDPFEIVKQEVATNLCSFNKSSDDETKEVLTENILLLTEENQDIQTSKQKLSAARLDELRKSSADDQISPFSNNDSCNTPDSVFENNIFTPPLKNKCLITLNDETNKSLQLSISQKKCNLDYQSTPKSRQSSSSSSASSGQKIKSSKSDVRNRLWKLSISNASSINSPVVEIDDRRGSKTSEDENSDNSVFTEAKHLAKHFSEMIISSPSISENSSFEDINSIKPNWIDSNTDIENDLKMMNIPILAEIDTMLQSQIKTAPPENLIKNDNNIAGSEKTAGIEALKKKIKQKYENDSQNVDILLNSLKNLVFECSTEEKKAEAGVLLESLSCLLQKDSNKIDSEKSTENNSKEIPAEIIVPQPIIRQATFVKHHHDSSDSDEETVLASSNDGNLERSTSPPDEQCQPEVCEIVEQIEKMLVGRHNVSIVQSQSNQNENTSFQCPPSNPTYIIVMGTPTKKLPSNHIGNDHANSSMHEIRRRSQSLSLHDKQIQMTKRFNDPISPPNRNFKTPPRNNYINRRNSISTTTPETNLRLSLNRQNIITKSTIQSCGDTKNLNRSSILDKSTSCITPKNSNRQSVNFKTNLSIKKLQFKAYEPSIRSKAPLKATIPVKRVAPMRSSSIVSPPKENNHKYEPILSTPDTFNNSISSFSSTLNPYKKSIRCSTTPNSKLSYQRRSFIDSRSPKKSLGGTKSEGVDRSSGKFLNRFKFENRQKPTTLNKENKQPKIGM